MPLSVGSVASKTGKTPSASQLQNLALSILRRSFIISSSDGMAMACIKTITNFLIPGIWRQGRPRKTWSECVKTNVHECGLAETEMHGELLFSIAWCCPSMAELWLKWNLTAPCLMRKPLSATLVICCVLVGAVTVPLLQMLCGMKEVQEIFACPDHKTPPT